MVDEAVSASGCPSSEALASYLDGRADADTKAAITAHLTECESCYDVVVESLRDLGTDDVQTVPEPELAPRARQSWKLFYTLGGLAAAAVLALVIIRPEWLTGVGGRSDPRFAALVAAVGDQRFVDGRLANGFRFGPLKSPTRSARPEGTQDLGILAAAAEAQKAAAARPTMETLHSSGVASLIVGDWDPAVAALERARTSSADPPATLLSDLSAAYAARAKRTGRTSDWPLAQRFAEQAIAKDGRLAEARFNLAIALEGLDSPEPAKAAWQRYLDLDGQSPWAEEARQHLRAPVAGPPVKPQP
jgi:predicted anti-sigma-YlaC factor YlaD